MAKTVQQFDLWKNTRFKLGYVPQYGGFIQDLNLLENLKLVGESI